LREDEALAKLVFGEYVLDPGSRQLLRRGRAVALSPKAFQLLQALLENRPRAVAKAELQQVLWPDTVVVEANLSNLVGEVRSALGDDPRRPRFVRTVHRFGYAFCGDAVATPSGRGRRETAIRLRWPGGSVELGPGEHVIGRDAHAAVCLASASVSRRHAIVRVQGGQATVEDLESKNGTYVNGARLERVRDLADGDEIRAGSVRVTVHARPSLVSTETAVTRSGKL
jgi:DNA-binding winged helix-turn-helix (wHTH) protein